MHFRKWPLWVCWGKLGEFEPAPSRRPEQGYPDGSFVDPPSRRPKTIWIHVTSFGPKVSLTQYRGWAFGFRWFPGYGPYTQEVREGFALDFGLWALLFWFGPMRVDPDIDFGHRMRIPLVKWAWRGGVPRPISVYLPFGTEGVDVDDVKEQMRRLEDIGRRGFDS